MLCAVGDLVEDVVVWLSATPRPATDTPVRIFHRRGGSAANVAAFAAGLAGQGPVHRPGRRRCPRRSARERPDGHRGRCPRAAGRTFRHDRGAGRRRRRAHDAARPGCRHRADGGAGRRGWPARRVLHVPAYSLDRRSRSPPPASRLAAGRLASVASPSASTRRAWPCWRSSASSASVALVEELAPAVFLANAEEAALLDLAATPPAPVTVVKDGSRPGRDRARRRRRRVPAGAGARRRRGGRHDGRRRRVRRRLPHGVVERERRRPTPREPGARWPSPCSLGRERRDGRPAARRERRGGRRRWPVARPWSPSSRRSSPTSACPTRPTPRRSSAALAAVRDAGAVPALTAVLDGVARVGRRRPSEHARICGPARKAAERDLPWPSPSAGPTAPRRCRRRWRWPTPPASGVRHRRHRRRAPRRRAHRRRVRRPRCHRPPPAGDGVRRRQGLPRPAPHARGAGAHRRAGARLAPRLVPAPSTPARRGCRCRTGSSRRRRWRRCHANRTRPDVGVLLAVPDPAGGRARTRPPSRSPSPPPWPTPPTPRSPARR